MFLHPNHNKLIMAHLILTGATGLVGSAALVHLLSLPASKVAKLSILSRRPVDAAEGRSNVEVIIQKDFSVFEPGLLAKLKGADGCIWAQGVSDFSTPICPDGSPCSLPSYRNLSLSQKSRANLS